MKLFLPSARATNWLLIVSFCSLGYALYLRYLVLQQSSVALACDAGLGTWLCFSRSIVIPLFQYDVFGAVALILAAIHLLRPSLLLFGAALAVACLGVVFYNEGLASLAAGLLILSLARRVPAPA